MRSVTSSIKYHSVLFIDALNTFYFQLYGVGMLGGALTLILHCSMVLIYKFLT